MLEDEVRKKPERSKNDQLRHSFEFAEPAYFMGSTTGGGPMSVTGASAGALLPQEVSENPARAAIRPRMVVIFIVIFIVSFEFLPAPPPPW